MQASLDAFFKPKKKVVDNSVYIIYFDGASRTNPGPASYGGVIYKSNAHGKEEIYNYREFIGKATNNEAEYRGLLNGLRLAKEKNLSNIQVFGDSKLIIEQVCGNWKIKSPHLKPFHREICQLKREFNSISFQHVYRKDNKRADELANQALDEEKDLKTV